MTVVDPIRLEWSLEVYRYLAKPLFERIWPGVTLDLVEGGGVSDRQRRMDFSGLDIIATLTDDTTYHLSQRYRSLVGNDYSFRYETAGKKGPVPAEYFKLKKAVEKGSYRPNYYAQGLTNIPSVGTKPQEFKDAEFRQFHIFEIDGFFHAVKRGRVSLMGPFENKDEITKGIYVSPSSIPDDIVKFTLHEEKKSSRKEKKVSDVFG